MGFIARVWSRYSTGSPTAMTTSVFQLASPSMMPSSRMSAAPPYRAKAGHRLFGAPLLLSCTSTKKPVTTGLMMSATKSELVSVMISVRGM